MLMLDKKVTIFTKNRVSKFNQNPSPMFWFLVKEQPFPNGNLKKLLAPLKQAGRQCYFIEQLETYLV